MRLAHRAAAAARRLERAAAGVAPRVRRDVRAGDLLAVPGISLAGVEWLVLEAPDTDEPGTHGADVWVVAVDSAPFVGSDDLDLSGLEVPGVGRGALGALVVRCAATARVPSAALEGAARSARLDAGTLGRVISRVRAAAAAGGEGEQDAEEIEHLDAIHAACSQLESLARDAARA